MNFDQAFDKLLGHEGKFSINRDDPGNWTGRAVGVGRLEGTMWGVTVAVARANGYKGKMIDLPRDAAKYIYKKFYWDLCHADLLPEAIRFDVFDAAVNSGVAQATRWLQRAAGVADDGDIGPITVAAAINAGPALAARFNGHRLQFMTDLSTWPSFSRGWARRIASNLLGD